MESYYVKVGDKELGPFLTKGAARAEAKALKEKGYDVTIKGHRVAETTLYEHFGNPEADVDLDDEDEKDIDLDDVDDDDGDVDDDDDEKGKSKKKTKDTTPADDEDDDEGPDTKPKGAPLWGRTWGGKDSD